MDLGFIGVDAKIPIEGNSPLLEEMLSNLIENAIRYGKHGGAIDVSIEMLADGKIVLGVRNEGAPIPETEREQIFERFYRIDGTGGNGCGLGLAIVRDVAHMHGGVVRLHTDDGVNDFRITFKAHVDTMRAHGRSAQIGSNAIAS